MSSVTLLSPRAEDQGANVRPKRVAAVKSKQVIEDNIDDSDEDPHFKGSHDEDSCSSHQSDEEPPEKKTKVTHSSKHVKVVYSAPTDIEAECASGKHIRENEMKEALGTDYVDKRWIPDQQDLDDEAKVFVARDMVKQLNFAQAELDADPSSIARMKAGKMPLIAEDRAWVAQTAWYLFLIRTACR
jgi:hypothetical protein